MELLLILTYTALCTAIFKLFKIPLNKWSVPTAALGGVVLIGTLFVVMNYNHPYAGISREYFVTTPISPVVTGTVIEVPVSPLTHLQQGDVLFVIDPVPFQNTVNALTSRLALAQDDAERATTLLESNNISQRDAQATFTRLATVTEELATAEFKLYHSVVRAPTDGYVAQMALRPGMRAVEFPLRPVMIFVHKESHYFVGWFRQNSMLRLKEGADAEVAFDGIPGRVFSGKVQTMLPAIAEGQVQPGSDLITAQMAPKPGLIPVRIEITDPEFEPFAGNVPGGAFAQAAIYSEKAHHLAVLRKILLRMSAWMNYIFPLH